MKNLKRDPPKLKFSESNKGDPYLSMCLPLCPWNTTQTFVPLNLTSTNQPQYKVSYPFATPTPLKTHTCPIYLPLLQTIKKYPMTVFKVKQALQKTYRKLLIGNKTCFKTFVPQSQEKQSFFLVKIKFNVHQCSRRGENQILANNSTTLRYPKKTHYSTITRVRISSQIGGYNSTRVIFESDL